MCVTFFQQAHSKLLLKHSATKCCITSAPSTALTPQHRCLLNNLSPQIVDSLSRLMLLTLASQGTVVTSLKLADINMNNAS